MPTGPIDLEVLPEPLLRKLLDVFRLEMRYDPASNVVECKVTITPEIVPAQYKTVQNTLGHGVDDHAAVRLVPPTGMIANRLDLPPRVPA